MLHTIGRGSGTTRNPVFSGIQLLMEISLVLHCFLFFYFKQNRSVPHRKLKALPGSQRNTVLFEALVRKSNLALTKKAGPPVGRLELPRDGHEDEQRSRLGKAHQTKKKSSSSLISRFQVRERNELLRFTSSPDNPLQSGMRKDKVVYFFCSQDSV